jgi:hypothetical protein
MSEKSREPGERMDVGPEQAARPFVEGPPREHRGRPSREDHLEAIRGLLDSGGYDVPAMAIAERMLARAAANRRDKD